MTNKINASTSHLCVRRAHGLRVHSPHGFSGCKWSKCCLSRRKQRNFLTVRRRKSWPRKIEVEWHEPKTKATTQHLGFINSLTTQNSQSSALVWITLVQNSLSDIAQFGSTLHADKSLTLLQCKILDSLLERSRSKLSVTVGPLNGWDSRKLKLKMKL